MAQRCHLAGCWELGARRGGALNHERLSCILFVRPGPARRPGEFAVPASMPGSDRMCDERTRAMSPPPIRFVRAAARSSNPTTHPQQFWPKLFGAWQFWARWGYLLITHEHIAETVANLGTKTTSGRPARTGSDVRGNWPARSGRCSDYLPGVGVIADVVHLANVGTTFHASLASEPPPSITEWCES